MYLNVFSFIFSEMLIMNLRKYVILQQVYQLISAISHVMSLDCPINECNCETSQNRPGRIINCRDKILDHIPKIVPSSELFYELTFSSGQDIHSQLCVNCNNISVLPSKAFSGLKVIKLNLNKNKIGSYSTSAFNGLEDSLQELCISGNAQIPPPYPALVNLTNLTTLHLEHFNQGFIDKNNYFSHFPNLQMLKLIQMNLNYIAGNSFQQRLQNLVTLEISQNEQLMTLPVNALNNLKSLQNLYLIQNGIRHIPYGSFRNLRNLKFLDLSKNSIQKLDGCFYVGIQNSLEHLDLSVNMLNEEAIDSTHDSNFTRLQHLDISRNKFNKIPSDILRHMQNLTVLNLEANKLGNISKGDLDMLPYLQELNLESNKLTFLAKGALSNLEHLTRLNMARQHEDQVNRKSMILRLTRESVSGIEEQLEELDLSETQLDIVDLWELIKKFKNLKVLKLGKTGINYIKDFVFSDFNNLETLQLNGNNISILRQESFHGLQQSLQYLDLSFNSITGIDHCVFENFDNLQMVTLYQNPLICDCDLKWFYTWLQERETYFPIIANLLCMGEQGKVFEASSFNESFICGDNYTQSTCRNLDTTASTQTTVTISLSTIYSNITGNSKRNHHTYPWTLLVCLYFTFLIALSLLFIFFLIC